MGAHKNLTGAELHEPKGVAAAAAGSVYIANGAGSGVWTSKNADVYNANYFPLTSYLPDIGAASSCWFHIPLKCELVSFTSVLRGAITATDAVLTVYINGVLFADTLTVPNAGSTSGQKNTKTVITANTVAAGSVVEIRSDGGPTNSIAADISLFCRSKA